jgi:hypothetical protein
MPADPAPSPLDPVRILHSLPEHEHGAFLAAYRQAVTAAAADPDPEGFGELLRVLRLWSGHALLAAQPGYAEAREAARRPASGVLLLDDVVREIRAARGQ